MFPVPFYFLRNTDILIDRLDRVGGIVSLTYGTDYTVNGAGDPNGGSIQTTHVVDAGYVLRIYRSVPATQETQFQQNDPFPSKTIEKALDKLTMLVQQANRGVGRALKFPNSDIDPITELPKALNRANRALGFDNRGDPFAIDLTIGSVTTPVVQTVAMLRLVAKTAATDVFVARYWADIPGGGGHYTQRYAVAPGGWENGGTQIVSADGAGWELAHDGLVSPRDFGARGEGVAGGISGPDDTAAVQAWLDVLSPTVAGYSDVGVFNVSATLHKVGSYISISGPGAGSSVFNVIGGASSDDVFCFGDGVTTCSYWSVSGFGIESAVTKSGDSAALHFKKFMVENSVANVAIGVIAQNKKLQHGFWFDVVNVMYLHRASVYRLLGDGIRVNGSATDDSGSDLYITQGTVTYCNVGLHCGGGFGGLYTVEFNSFVNGINYLIDNTIAAFRNREMFFSQDTVSDGALIAGIVIDDTHTSNAPIVMGMMIGSSGQFGGPGPHHGLWVKNWPNGRISVNSGQIMNNLGDGVHTDDSSVVLAIGSTASIFNNTGWGVAASVRSYLIYYFGCYMDRNGAGDLHPNTGCANGTTFAPSIGATSGALGAYSATGRWTTHAKQAGFTIYATVSDVGTAAGALRIPLPFQVRQAVTVQGSDQSLGTALTGYIDANSSTLVVRKADGSFPAHNGATLSLTGGGIEFA
ncbi:hypothetical protein CFB48_11925 [Burkholderia sp. AU33647]|nr:hypothetical protein CFB48_11925 [Burkholderia sp. AU33647]